MFSVAIVGRPNVGKSSLFNRLLGERHAITSDIPGVTRDRLYAKCTWLTKTFNIIDTGGIEIADAPFLTLIKEQAEIAINEADLVILVVDGNAGVTETDLIVARILYKSKKPVIIAVNKIDDVTKIYLTYDFYQLGFEQVFPISSMHGIGIGDLLDEVIKYFKEDEEDNYQNAIKFCIVGRPNVGKSSLTNAILGENRSITSPIAGTTTDATDTKFTYDAKDYVIIDTAGIKKRGTIYETTDLYAYFRTIKALEKCDIALFVLDASVPITEADKNVAGYILDAKKACIIVVNKWDLVKKETNTMVDFEKYIYETFPFLSYAKVVFLSSVNLKRIYTLFPVLDTTYANYFKRINTSLLNEVIQNAYLITPPKLYNKAIVKIYYATQVSCGPPLIAIFCNDPEHMHFSYERFIKNEIRKAFDFSGVPIQLSVRKRD